MTTGSFLLTLRAIGETFAISAPTVVDSVRGRVSRRVCDERLWGWGRRVVSQADIELEVRGYDRVPANETFVIMSNHQSHYDVPVLYRAFPRTLRMVAKTELFRIPVFAAAMRAAEMIEVDRANASRARESLATARDRLRSGINVWIAPEGTRSPTGKLGSFKKGGFIIALETGSRILPVTIVGTHRVLPSTAVTVRKGQRVVVTFHPPIDPKDYGISRRDELVSAVRASIASALPA